VNSGLTHIASLGALLGKSSLALKLADSVFVVSDNSL
jgi:hypothetical protein